jgi:diguanylate cyclase (GGDEF)-like protein
LQKNAKTNILYKKSPEVPAPRAIRTSGHQKNNARHFQSGKTGDNMRQSIIAKTPLLRSKWTLPLLVFFLTISSGGFIIFKLESANREIESARVTQILSIYANATERVFEHALSATNALAVMVHQGNGNVSDFPQLARYLLPLYKGAFALSLAPGGIIRQIEPSERNILIRNHDLFEGKNRAAVMRTMNEDVLEFAGPFKLIQGPMGAIGQLPVFLTSPTGQRYFWGYTVVTLKFPDAFENANLESIEEQGYAYRLWGTDPETGKPTTIAASSIPLQENPFTRPVKIYGNVWTLDISKTRPWYYRVRLLFEILLTFFGSLLMGWLAYSVVGISLHRRELQKIALYDSLTGLPNRRLLVERLHMAIERARRQKCLVAVCYLDLDGFKQVNDSLGHAAGDRLLIEMASRLQACLRTTDTLARIGGDEFVIVLSDLELVEECEEILQRMIHSANLPMKLDGAEAIVSASIGAAFFGVNGDDADQLLRRADQTMYLAKKSGKNRYLLA